MTSTMRISNAGDRGAARPTAPLGEKSFRTLAEIVERHAGIKLSPAKRSMVEGRLRERVSILGFATTDAYLAHALDPAQRSDELVHLINAITTNKTDFFREPQHFTFLQEVAIPTLVRGRGGQPARIKVWSAACSTGAEAYTIAMVLQDMATERQDFRYAILGTDIATPVLAEAASGVYPVAMVAAVPPDKRRRYLMRSKDPAQKTARIVPELRRTTRFERLNLMDSHYPYDADIDVIFCRNVLIYFAKPTQQAVVRRLAAHLRPGGYLLLGHAESMLGADIPGLQQVRPALFQASGEP